MLEEATAEELLARVARRDAVALRALYKRFAPRMLALAQRILGDRAAAEGVLDQAFTRIWRASGRLSRQGVSVAAWLTLTTRTLALERRRCDSDGAKDDQGPDLLSKLSACPTPEKIAALDRQRALMDKVVNQLPRHQRDALDLVAFEGCTESEVAARLGEPLGLAKSELRAAMRFLRHRLRAVMGAWTADI